MMHSPVSLLKGPGGTLLLVQTGTDQHPLLPHSHPTHSSERVPGEQVEAGLPLHWGNEAFFSGLPAERSQPALGLLF